MKKYWEKGQIRRESVDKKSLDKRIFVYQRKFTKDQMLRIKLQILSESVRVFIVFFSETDTRTFGQLFPNNQKTTFNWQTMDQLCFHLKQWSQLYNYK